MNPWIHRTTTICALLIASVLICLAPAPTTQAVSPPPDGGYARGNTAEGQNALSSLASGGFNTAVGFLSLRNDTFGGFNTAIGAGSLLANGADQNTATGAGALLSNTTGGQNTANGSLALFFNTVGFNNTANGQVALFDNTTGSENTATGAGALLPNTTGNSNTANGFEALSSAGTASKIATTPVIPKIAASKADFMWLNRPKPYPANSPTRCANAFRTQCPFRSIPSTETARRSFKKSQAQSAAMQFVPLDHVASRIINADHRIV